MKRLQGCEKLNSQNFCLVKFKGSIDGYSMQMTMKESYA